MIKTPKENQEFKRWINPNPGDPAKPRQTRPKRLAPSGRAQTCQVSLTPTQAVWLASRGCPASAVLRMLVEDAMKADQADQDDLSDRSPARPDLALQSP